MQHEKASDRFIFNTEEGQEITIKDLYIQLVRIGDAAECIKCKLDDIDDSLWRLKSLNT